MHTVKNLAPSTIEGYKTALHVTFRYTGGPDVSGNQEIVNLLRFYSSKPKLVKDLPDWDLSFVLVALTQPPYEPLSSATLMDLTLKTYFLLLLASGRRRSELLAIDIRRTETKEHGQSLFLFPNKAFVPKTQAALEATGKAFSPILLPSLSSTLAKDDPDSFFCPVRAYHAYLHRTKPFRGSRNSLFLPAQAGRKSDLKVNTLTSWTKRLISDVYQTANPQTKRLYNIRPHAIRGLATSLAEASGASMADILRAGTWTNHTTFSSFYLSDATVLRDNLKRLSPLVVAQHRLC